METLKYNYIPQRLTVRNRQKIDGTIKEGRSAPAAEG